MEPLEYYLEPPVICKDCGNKINIDEHNYGTENLPICYFCYSLQEKEFEEKKIY